MSYDLDLDLDQQRIEEQDAVAIDLHAEGVTDGYEGNKPQSGKGWEYLKGYGEGCRYKAAMLGCELALLKDLSNQVEARLSEVLEEF